MKKSLCCLSILLIFGCGPYKSVEEVRFSQATIQKNISTGMGTSEVVKALGAPNIITRNKAGEISWVYDSVKTIYHKEYNDLTMFNLNGKDFVIATASAAAYLGYQALKAASISTGNSLAGTVLIFSATALGVNSLIGDKKEISERKTLTLILDFNQNEQLETFSYHYTSF